MTTEESLDSKTIAKAQAFDLLVEARRKVLGAARARRSGGQYGIVGGLESFSTSTREFAALAKSLCDKAIDDTLVKAFDDFWSECYRDRSPDSVMILKYPKNAGKGEVTHS